MTDIEHPHQYTEMQDGVFRFRPNRIIEWLFETERLDLNLIARMGDAFDDADRRQLAQLLGYSVSGYFDLSYAEGDPVVESAYYDDNGRPIPDIREVTES